MVIDINHKKTSFSSYMCFKMYEYNKSITEQVDWRGNASDLYLGGAQFES